MQTHAKDLKSTKDVKYIKLRPLWRESWSATIDGEIRLIVPTAGSKIQNEDIQIQRFFIFENIQGFGIDGKIVEFVAVKSNLKAKFNERNIKNGQKQN